MMTTRESNRRVGRRTGRGSSTRLVGVLFCAIAMISTSATSLSGAHAARTKEESKLAEQLSLWFRRYQRGDAACRLFQQSDLLALGGGDAYNGWSTVGNPVLSEYDAYARAAPNEIEWVTPSRLIEQIRSSDLVARSPARDRFLAYAELLDLFDATVESRDRVGLMMLLEIAAYDVDRVYDQNEWKRAARYRPHLVRREAKRALMRGVPALVAPILLERLMQPAGSANTSEFELAARIAARIVMRDGIPNFTRFKTMQALLHVVLTGEEPLGRAEAAFALAEMYSVAGTAPLEEDRIRRLLDRVGAEDSDRATVGLLHLLSCFPRPYVVQHLASLMAAGKKTREVDESLQDALDALTPITVDGLANRAAWLDWYERDRGTKEFALWYESKVSLSVPPPQPVYANAPRFYNVPIVGRRVVFVIDRSGSMGEMMEGGASTKVAMAKSELMGSLGALNDASSFAIVFFADGSKRWPDHLVRATDGNIDRAKAFVQRLAPSGWTDLCEGLLSALGVKRIGDDLHKVPYADRPDQVILLSDGNPTAGLIQNTIDIIDEVGRLNPHGLIRIDTIAFGPDADRGFLEALARSNGGEMAVVSDSP